jgi:prepilin-type N-terminal cleavage/methylation domain-containing protein
MTIFAKERQVGRTYARTTESERAFTLIELLVVVAIIGLLASIILVSLGQAQKKGRDSRRLGDLKEIQTALELYYTDHTSYPVATSQTTASTALASALAPTYIASVGDDPLGGSYHYVYITDAGGTKYCIGSILETTAPSGISASCTNGLTLTGVQYTVNP